jgi:hypothetical protein
MNNKMLGIDNTQIMSGSSLNNSDGDLVFEDDE